MAHYPILIAIAILAPLAEAPQDRDGWRLRVMPRPAITELFAGESLRPIECWFLLMNTSSETRRHVALEVARESGALTVDIVHQDGETLATVGLPGVRNKFAQSLEIRSAHAIVETVKLGAYGFDTIRRAGSYALQATLRIDKLVIKSPPVHIRVISIPRDAIVSKHEVNAEGQELARPIDEQFRTSIEKVVHGKKTVVLFRRHYGQKWGGDVESTVRIIETFGSVDIKQVEGASGSGNPLTLTLLFDSSTATEHSAKIKINSVNGQRWTAAEEESRQKRLRERK